MENHEKPQKRQNWGVGTCSGMGTCLGQYHRIGLSGAHRYLAHTAYQAHVVFLTKPIQTLDKKRTALIERKFGVGKGKYSTTGQEQAHSVNEDHFTMGITFAIANQKCARNVKRTMKTSDMALLFIASFAITILDVLIECEFR